MLRVIYLLLVLCLTFQQLYAQDVLSKEEAIKDIEFTYKRLNQIHPGLYRYQRAEDYQQIFKDIKESIVDSISYFDFFLRLSPLISEVKDLHTNYNHSKIYKKKHANWLPFIMKEIEGKNLVIFNLSSDPTFTKGLEILEVDSHEIEEIKVFLRNHIGTDNDNEAAKQIYSTKQLYGYYPKFFVLGDSVNVLTRYPENDSLVSFRLKTVKPKEFSANISLRYPSKIRKNLIYTLIDSTSLTAKIDVSSFVQKGSPFDIFQTKFHKNLKKNFKQIKQDAIQNLVLDFRGNGGGYIPNVKKLTKYVATEPFKLMDTMALRRSAYFRIFPV